MPLSIWGASASNSYFDEGRRSYSEERREFVAKIASVKPPVRSVPSTCPHHSGSSAPSIVFDVELRGVLLCGRRDV